MAVIRVNKTGDYTVMSNTHFKEREMSLKAKGLLSLMLSLPDTWDYSIAGLVTLSKDGKDGVMNALAELEEFGYLVRTQAIDERGRFAGYDYDIYEKPQTEKPQTEKPYAENPNTVKPNTENPQQLNTNKSNTNSLNNKELNTEGIGEKRARFVPPTLEEVKEYCIERNNNVDPQRFIDYYTSNGWLVGKNKMKDWKAAVRTWERNGYSDKNPKSTNSSFDVDDFFNAAINKSYGVRSPRTALEREAVNRAEENAKNPPKTAGDDEAVREKMERLKERLGT